MKLKNVETFLTPHVMQVGSFESQSGEQVTVFFRSIDRIEAPQLTDHFFIVGVIASYLRGESYTHPEPISEVLYNNIITVMQKWSLWWRYPAIKVTVETFADTTEPAKKPHRGCLMTAGVDSLFTARTLQDEIDAFVNVAHCRFDAAKTDAAKMSNNSIAAFSQEQGKELFQVETNVMSAFSQIEDAWSSISHGPCYAAIGHFLGGNISELMISASFSNDQMRPWGSHPEIDRLYSSNAFRFRHVGVGFNRFQKHREIASDQSCLRYLSVCENGPQEGEHINCSKCQKCLRSMITLDLLDIERLQAPTFNWDGYHPENLKKFLLQGHVNTSELLAYAEEIGRMDIAAILKDVIDYADKYYWLVRAELFLRRRMNGWLRFKPFLKRLRAIAYRLFGVRQRHQTSTARAPQNDTSTSLKTEPRRD